VEEGMFRVLGSIPRIKKKKTKLREYSKKEIL
jgi:hypothetical protein